jgi:hypothetical protein
LASPISQIYCCVTEKSVAIPYILQNVWRPFLLYLWLGIRLTDRAEKSAIVLAVSFYKLTSLLAIE